jgi:CheW-like domain
LTRELKNVIVFTLGSASGDRHAAELRWIREVVTLGFVTVIPGAPPGFAGAVNLRGNLMPVLDPRALLDGDQATLARQGDPALIVEEHGVLAALRVSQVHEVATCVASGDQVIDGRGRSLPLLDPRALLRRAQSVAQATRTAGAGDDGEPRDDSARGRMDPITGVALTPPLTGDSTVG